MPIKILYVEDEPFLGKIVRESLESRGFEVRLIEDGAQAMAALEAMQPDIGVLDVMLPNLDGFSLGKAIREKDPLLPILFLTAKDQTKDVLQGFASGGNDYIRKPFSMEELIVRIQNLLQLKGRADSHLTEWIALGKYLFSPIRQELKLEEQIRKLSYRETQLLQMLSAQLNQPIDRREILREIWGDDSFYHSRNLDVYMTRLREYLKGDAQVEIITLKGVGYRLSV
ncbi:MAG TPA: response regulator transcription factor [Saprospiraceae bacterium]|nr:response regulator transcription factor [Saprospiraceae bacterium]HMQ81922.1 response regulator transcription factor [Saprospiraceae bacterium]